MLLSWTDGEAFLATDGLAELTSVTVENAALSRNPLYRPEDPSTLTLALIGVATLAAYFATSRTRRGRTPTVPPTTVDVVQSSEADAEQPSRGAA